MAEISWLEVTLASKAEGVDWVRMAVAATASDTSTKTSILVMPLATDSEWNYSVQITFANTWAGRKQLEALLQKLSPLERSGITAPPEIDEVETPNTGTNLASVEKIGRFVIALPQAEVALQPGDLPLYLPSSLGFGSGNHPATVLSLGLIQRYWETQTPVRPRVLDLGCGSGILSLACARLGGQVLALDNDPVAVEATQAAVAANGLAQQITIQTGSLGHGSEFGHWLGCEVASEITAVAATGIDLLVANVLARLHLALANDYAATLQVGGCLITAGFTTDYEAEVNAGLQAAGLVQVDRGTSNEWVALMHARRA
jgi:ribosomal protein L11 methyltransferase